jgi:hypothetical protein
MSKNEKLNFLASPQSGKILPNSGRSPSPTYITSDLVATRPPAVDAAAPTSPTGHCEGFKLADRRSFVGQSVL